MVQGHGAVLMYGHMLHYSREAVWLCGAQKLSRSVQQLRCEQMHEFPTIRCQIHPQLSGLVIITMLYSIHQDEQAEIRYMLRNSMNQQSLRWEALRWMWVLQPLAKHDMIPVQAVHIPTIP